MHFCNRSPRHLFTRTAPSFLLAAFLPVAVHAADWHVALTGSDQAGDGSAAKPFATPQRGVDAAQPGDTVRVAQGVYRGNVIFPRSGTREARITLVGEPGTILDSGVRFSGWEADPTRPGTGVYRIPLAALPFKPAHMTWNNRYILRLNEGQAKIKETEAYYARLTAPPTDASWDGVEAFFGTRDDFLYVRFRHREDPSREDITFNRERSQPGAATINVDSRSFITIRGFQIQGGGAGVALRRGANDNIVENNFILHGRDGIHVGGFASPPVPSHRNIIRHNRITLNYVHDLSPRHKLHGHIWNQFKEYSDTDRHAVYLFYAGDDNEVYGNEIFQHWDGVQDSAGGATREEYASYCRRLKVHHNVFREMGDDALEPTGGEIDAEYYNNVSTDVLIALRIKDVKVGPCYIYGNQFSSWKGGRDIFYFAGSVGTVYLYHNTFANPAGLVMGSTTTELGAPNVWFINNIFSNERFWRTTERWKMDAHAHHNWIGGDAQKFSWIADDNTVAPGARLWEPGEANFLLTADSPARGKGIDLSQSVTLGGKTLPPMPGMKPGYFQGLRPDLGAVQFGQKPKSAVLPPRQGD